MKRLTVQFTGEQWDIIEKTKMGNTDAEKVRGIVLAWLGEKSLISTEIKKEMARPIKQADRLMILKLIYDKKETDSDILVALTEFTKNQIREVIQYFVEKGWAKAKFVLSGDAIMIKLIAEGIDIVEGNKQIIKKIEAGLNIGIASIKWEF